MLSFEKRALRSFTSGTILFVITFVGNLLTVPLLLSSFNIEMYGLYIAIISFMSLVKLLDTAHHTYIGNELNVYYFDDIDKARRLFGTSFWMSVVVSIVEAVFFYIVWFYFSSTFIRDLHVLESITGKFLIFIYGLVWILTGSFTGLVVKLLPIVGKYETTNFLGILGKCTELCLLLIVSYLNLPLSALFGLLGLQLLALVFFYYSVYRKYLFELSEGLRYFQPKLGLHNLGKSLFLLVNNFTDYVSNAGLSLLISKLGNISLLPLMTTMRTIVNTPTMLVNLFLNPISSDLIRLKSIGNYKSLNGLISLSVSLSVSTTTLVFYLTAPWIESAYNFWTSNLLDFNDYLYIILAIAVCFTNVGKVYHIYVSGNNDLNRLLILNLAKIILYVCLSGILIKLYGLIGVGLILLIGEVVLFFINPLFFYRMIFDMNKALILDKITLSIAILEIVVLCASLVSLFVFDNIVLFLSCAPLLFLLYYFQWSFIDLEFRRRLTRHFKLNAFLK
jgi:O-antigen/teichoic acid export membrane protein